MVQSFGRKSFSEELKQLSFFQMGRNPGAGPGPSCSSAEKEGDLGISSRAWRRREQGPTHEKLDIFQLRIFRIIIVDSAVISCCGYQSCISPSKIFLRSGGSRVFDFQRMCTRYLGCCRAYIFILSPAMTQK